MLENRVRLMATGIFLAVIVLLALDISEDLESGSSLSHVIEEGVIVFLGLLGVLVLWFEFFKTKDSLFRTQDDLGRVRRDLNEYKESTRALTSGLAEKIDEQLAKWNLTKAEKEIAMLILKGLNNKEIAECRHSSEKTVRQQASSIYQKSQLKGRQELSAFFLEDLLVLPDRHNP